MLYRVTFMPAAELQLRSLYRYIASQASPDIAERYVSAIIGQCHGLDSFPHRGTSRDDLRLGLRTLAFRRRVVIAYVTDSDEVVVLGIFYGGQDIDVILEEPG